MAYSKFPMIDVLHGKTIETASLVECCVADPAGIWTRIVLRFTDGTDVAILSHDYEYYEPKK